MFRSLLKLLIGLVVMSMALGLLSDLAIAQPPTYLPYQAGSAYSVSQGNNQSPSHADQYNRYGWDFAMPTGTPVLAAAPGRVTSAGWDNTGWGNTVRVCYGDGSCSRYAHLSQISVGNGQSVGQAQVIGYSGSTGRSSGPHLHYQLETSGGLSAASSFVEAGVPRTGDRPVSRNSPGPSGPQFEDIRIYSSPVIGVRAGDRVSAAVTARYLGPSAIPCGQVNLGTRDDAPARFADYSAGYWPQSTWRSPNRVAAVGCQGSLQPGQSAHWDLSFRVPDDTPSGIYPTATYAPVWEGVGWSEQRFVISLAVDAGYQAELVSQTYLGGPLRHGQRSTVTITFRNVGWRTWSADGAHAVHLRGIRPQDRQSGFIDSGDPRAIGQSGARLPADVTPGQSVTVTLPLKVADWIPPGRYPEYFRLVAEGIDWFGRDDVWWPITVE